MSVDCGFELISGGPGENVRVFLPEEIAHVFEKLFREKSISLQNLFLFRPDMPRLAIKRSQEIVKSGDHNLGEDRPRLRLSC